MRAPLGRVRGKDLMVLGSDFGVRVWGVRGAGHDPSRSAKRGRFPLPLQLQWGGGLQPE